MNHGLQRGHFLGKAPRQAMVGHFPMKHFDRATAILLFVTPVENRRKSSARQHSRRNESPVERGIDERVRLRRNRIHSQSSKIGQPAALNPPASPL